MRLALAIICAAILACSSGPVEQPTVRADVKFTEGYMDAVWGMSMEETRQAFNQEQVSANGVPWYYDWIHNRRCEVITYHNDDSLYKVMVRFTELFQEQEEADAFFDELYTILTGKYGPASIATEPAGYGMGGGAWSTSQSQIMLVMNTDEAFNYRIAIVYECNRIAAQLRALKDAAADSIRSESAKKL